MKIIIHRLFQKDLSSALRYYDEEGGRELGDRFFAEVERTVVRIETEPKHFHFVAERIRRAQLRTFPYHILFEETDGKISVLVLRHDKRHPSFGRNRRSPRE